MTPISSNPPVTTIVPKGFNDLPDIITAEVLKFVPSQLVQLTTLTKAVKKITDHQVIWKEAAQSLHIDLQMDTWGSTPKEAFKDRLWRLLRAVKESALYFGSGTYNKIFETKDSLIRLEAYRNAIRSMGTEGPSGGLHIIESLPADRSKFMIHDLFDVLNYFIETGFAVRDFHWQVAFDNIAKLFDPSNFFPTYRSALALKGLMEAFMKNDHIKQGFSDVFYITPADKHKIMQKLIDKLLSQNNDEELAIQFALEAWARPSEAAITGLLSRTINALNNPDVDPFKLLLRVQMVCNFLSEEKRNSFIAWLDTLPIEDNEKSLPIVRKMLQKQDFIPILKELKLVPRISNLMNPTFWHYSHTQLSKPLSLELYVLIRNNTKTDEGRKFFLDLLRKEEEVTEKTMVSKKLNFHSDMHFYAKIRAIIAGESYEKAKLAMVAAPPS